MTIHDRGFWLYMVFLALLGGAIVGGLLVVNYHLGFELRNEFMVMDIGASSFSLQWPKGDIAFWVSTGRSDWRVWPP